MQGSGVPDKMQEEAAAMQQAQAQPLPEEEAAVPELPPEEPLV
jgi:hypothetical protein